MAFTKENASRIGRLGGRPRGRRSDIALFIQDFGRRLFRSEVFQANVRRKFDDLSLDSRLMVFLLQHGFGRPPLKVVVSDAGAASGRARLVERVRSLSREDRLAFAESSRRLLEIEGRMLAAPAPVVVDAVSVRVAPPRQRRAKVGVR